MTLASVEDRFDSRKADVRRDLGMFSSREAAEKHEREVQSFKHH